MLIDLCQIDFGPIKSDLEDPNHRHIPRYSDYPNHFKEYIPYNNDCPVCMAISEENFLWIKNKEEESL